MKLVLIICALLALSVAQYSKKCARTSKVVPFAHKRPMASNKAQVCNMHEMSCCGFISEAAMKKDARANFTQNLVLVSKSLEAMSSDEIRQLTPTVFSEEFNDKVQSAGDVTVQELARTAIRAYISEPCDVEDLVWDISGEVKSIANNLAALYKGLGVIKSILQIVREYKISEECVVAVMRNGVAIRSDFKNSMCNACIRDTIGYSTCKKTCFTTVQGCYSELTEISEALDRLAINMDAVHYTLLQELQIDLGALNQAELKIQQRLSDLDVSCGTGKALSFMAKDTMVQPAKFSGKPLGLKDLMKRSLDLHCVSARTVMNCWTAAGFSNETQEQLSFTADDQYKNTILPKTDSKSEIVKRGEMELMEALETAVKAHGSQGIFREEERPEIVEVEEIPTDEVIEEADGGEEDKESVENSESMEDDKNKDEKDEKEMEGEKDMEDKQDNQENKDSEDEGKPEDVDDNKMEDNTEKDENNDEPKEKDDEKDAEKVDGEDKDKDDGYNNEENDTEEEEDLDTNAVEGKSTGDSSSGSLAAASTVAMVSVIVRLVA